MEETPEIIMRCPRCAREFSPETCYCETCSVMLEPVEIAAYQDGEETGLQDPSGTLVPHEEDKLPGDVKIDSLKTDVEETFTLAMLLELRQLRKRLTGVNLPADDENSGSQSGPCESGPADEIIRKRIAKLEAILETLEKKIKSEITELEARLAKLKTPGLFAFLTSEGRTSRMLASELKIKYAALDSIQGKNPRPSIKRFFWQTSAAIIAVVILTAALWTVFSAGAGRQPVPVTPPAISAPHTDAEKDIDIKDIVKLLENIKKANLKKDLSLWEAGYSKAYPALTKKRKGIQKLWRNFDYTSLEYRIDGVNASPASAHALITWDIVLRARKTGTVLRRSEPLFADFIREDNTLKILSIRTNAR